MTPELGQTFEAQLLAALDSEYLYTLIRWWTLGTCWSSVPVSDMAGVRKLQALQKIWTCTQELYADVVVSWSDEPRPQDGEKYRTARLMLVHRPAFARLLDRKQIVFGPCRFTGNSNPSVVYYAAWHGNDELDRMLG